MKKLRKFRPSQIASAVLFVLAGYVAVCATVFFIQKDLVFFPLRQTIDFPTGSGYYSETFYNSDGQALSAFGKDSGAPFTVLYFHGNGGNLERAYGELSTFVSAGADFYAIDYRGYGMSSGHIEKEADLYADALSAYDRLAARWVPPQKIVVWGRSLGGTAAIKVAASRKVAGLVVESSFTSMDDMAENQYPYLPVRLLNRFHFRSVDDAPKISAPTLVIHSKDDELIPFEQWKALYSAVSAPKTFLEITGFHNGGHFENDGKIADAFRRFLNGPVAKGGRPI